MYFPLTFSVFLSFVSDSLLSSAKPISFVFWSKKKEACSKPASSDFPNEFISSISLLNSSSVCPSGSPADFSSGICTLPDEVPLPLPSSLPAPLSSTFPLWRTGSPACAFSGNLSSVCPSGCSPPYPLLSFSPPVFLDGTVCCISSSRFLSDTPLPSFRICPPASCSLSPVAFPDSDTSFRPLPRDKSISFLPSVTLLSFSIRLTL